MAPKYVLNYFNFKGRAETVRLMFAVAGVEFTDNRIKGEEWPANKADIKRFPLGTMPTLQVDNKVITQSTAINRYLARELGFYGSNSLEKATIDQVYDTLLEMATPFTSILREEKDEEKKKAKMSDIFAAEVLKRQLTFLENFLQANNGGNSFFVGDKISLADIAFFTLMAMFLDVNPKALDSNIPLKALHDRVAANERIAAWNKAHN